MARDFVLRIGLLRHFVGSAAPILRATGGLLRELNLETRMSEPVVLKLNLTAAQYEDMRGLMRLCGVSKEKDLIDNALSLLDWAIKENAGGKIIASVDERNRKYETLNMPIFIHMPASKS